MATAAATARPKATMGAGGPLGGGSLAGVGGGHHELLPQAVRVLERELAREGVEAPQALYRHQERFIGGEPRSGQGRDLLAQVVFQLRDVDCMDRLPTAQVIPPLCDLLFEHWSGCL